MQGDSVFGQQSVNLHAGTVSEHLFYLTFGESPAAIALDRQQFGRSARGILARRS